MKIMKTSLFPKAKKLTIFLMQNAKVDNFSFIL